MCFCRGGIGWHVRVTGGRAQAGPAVGEMKRDIPGDAGSGGLIERMKSFWPQVFSSFYAGLRVQSSEFSNLRTVPSGLIFRGWVTRQRTKHQNAGSDSQTKNANDETGHIDEILDKANQRRNVVKNV
jgi:hypothetical protein